MILLSISWMEKMVEEICKYNMDRTHHVQNLWILEISIVLINMVPLLNLTIETKTPIITNMPFFHRTINWMIQQHNPLTLIKAGFMFKTQNYIFYKGKQRRAYVYI